MKTTRGEKNSHRSFCGITTLRSWLAFIRGLPPAVFSGEYKKTHGVVRRESASGLQRTPSEARINGLTDEEDYAKTQNM